jgi:copper chaperone CopZ
MKIILAAATLTLLVACARQSSVEQVKPAGQTKAVESIQPAEPIKPTEVQTVSYRLLIEGMMCENCAAHVKGILEALPGVESAEVDLAHHQATVKVKGGQAFDESAAKDALDKDSYTLKSCAVAS